MNRAFEATGAVPVIDSRFALHDACAAYERMASGAAFGKVLVMLARRRSAGGAYTNLKA